MQRGADLVRKLLKAGWPDGVVLNVNFLTVNRKP